MLLAGWLNVQEPSDIQPIPVSASQGQLPPGAAFHPKLIDALCWLLSVPCTTPYLFWHMSCGAVDLMPVHLFYPSMLFPTSTSFDCACQLFSSHHSCCWNYKLLLTATSALQSRALCAHTFVTKSYAGKLSIITVVSHQLCMGGQDNMEREVESYLRRKYEASIRDIEVVHKEDLDLVRAANQSTPTS